MNNQDEVDKGIEDNLRNGYMEEFTKDGEIFYRLTETGKAYVDGLLKNNPRLFQEMGLDNGLH